MIDCHKIIELLQPFGRRDRVDIHGRNYEVLTWETTVAVVLVGGRVRHERRDWRRTVRYDEWINERLHDSDFVLHQ